MALKGSITPTDTRNKISAAKKGIPLSIENRRKLSLSHKGKSHSEEHKAAISAGLRNSSKIRRGIENHLYIDGRKDLWRGKDWWVMRKLAKERDNYTCQVCKIVSPKRLQVHHIISWGKCHSNELSNLISLCLSCHSKVEHGKFCIITPCLIIEN